MLRIAAHHNRRLGLTAFGQKRVPRRFSCPQVGRCPHVDKACRRSQKGLAPRRSPVLICFVAEVVSFSQGR